MARTKTQTKSPFKGGKKHVHKTATKKPVEITASLQAAGKPTKFKPGSLALREIRKYQKSSDLLLRKIPFKRIVRQEVRKLDETNEMRFQQASFSVL